MNAKAHVVVRNSGALGVLIALASDDRVSWRAGQLTREDVELRLETFVEGLEELYRDRW